MSKELKELIDWARDHEMTPEELEEQRISFAFGNARGDDRGTKESVAASLRAAKVRKEDKHEDQQ